MQYSSESEGEFSEDDWGTVSSSYVSSSKGKRSFKDKSSHHHHDRTDIILRARAASAMYGMIPVPMFMDTRGQLLFNALQRDADTFMAKTMETTKEAMEEAYGSSEGWCKLMVKTLKNNIDTWDMAVLQDRWRNIQKNLRNAREILNSCFVIFGWSIFKRDAYGNERKVIMSGGELNPYEFVRQFYNHLFHTREVETEMYFNADTRPRNFVICSSIISAFSDFATKEKFMLQPKEEKQEEKKKDFQPQTQPQTNAVREVQPPEQIPPQFSQPAPYMASGAAPPPYPPHSIPSHSVYSNVQGPGLKRDKTVNWGTSNIARIPGVNGGITQNAQKFLSQQKQDPAVGFSQVPIARREQSNLQRLPIQPEQVQKTNSKHTATPPHLTKSSQPSKNPASQPTQEKKSKPPKDENDIFDDDLDDDELDDGEEEFVGDEDEEDDGSDIEYDDEEENEDEDEEEDEEDDNGSLLLEDD